MEARHWWLVNRIQETFKFGINDSPVLYEQFLADPSHICEINKFLSAQGCRLLIFYDVFSDDTPSSRELRVVTEPTPEVDIYQESNLAAVFFRPEVLTEELDLTSLQQDVMCVELKLNDLTAMLALITQLYLPMVEQEALTRQTIPQHEIENYRRSVDEHLQELTTLVEKADPHLTILTPHTKFIRDPNWRNSPMAPDICTTMLQDWLPTIHSHLTDVIDTPSMEVDTQSSPMEELRKWNARQRLFTSILKQMRGQEIKSTVKLLTTSKPDLVHMWGEAENQVIHINSVAKNKVIFLNTINNHFSTMLHCSSIESLNTNLSTINSNPGFFLGFQLPSQCGYLGYIYYKLVCTAIKLSATLLLTTKPVMSSWFLLDANKGSENYPKFLKSLSEILKLEENLVQHFELLKEKGLLHNVSTLSTKTREVFEDQNIYKEFSSTQTLLSPLRDYTQHIHSLLNLSNEISKLGKLAIRLMPYPYIPDIIWKDNPIIISSKSSIMINISDDEDEFFQDNPPVILRKKRPIGSGKMGILLEVDEEKNLDTPVRSIQNTDSDDSSEITECDQLREISQRLYSNSSDQISSWLDNNLMYAYEELPKGPEFLFGPNSSNYESFDKILSCILTSIEVLNGNIELTITELTNCQFSMYEQLSLIDIFNEWAVVQKAAEFSKSYLSKAFSQTEEKIFSIERRFLDEKFSPSKLIDVTRVSESVRWSRLLLEKVEQPMQRLSKYELVLKNPEYVETFSKYNTFRSDLKHYEKIWVKFCHEAIKEIEKQQQNKLLVIPQENELIRINLNPIIFIAIRELKSLVKLGIRDVYKRQIIPVKSQELLFNEERLKGNFDRLNLLKCEFLKFYSQIPEYLIPLYEPRLKLFLKSLQPGWTHLNWKNINLDIFFEAANRELTKLNISLKEVSFDISFAKDTFQSNLQNLPSVLNNVLTSDSSFTIEQFQSQITNFTDKARSKMENHLQTFHFIICRSYLKINQLYQEYESYSQEEIFEMMNDNLEKDSNSSSMKCFLQYYISWSHECLYTWVTDQLQQYLSLVNFTLHQTKENDGFLEKQLSNLQIEMAPVLVNLHKFVIASDFNEVMKSFAKNKLRISCEVIFEVPCVVSVPSYETISETILDCFDQIVTVFSSLFTPRFAKLSEEEEISAMTPSQIIVKATNIRSAMKFSLIELIHPLRLIFNFLSNFDSIRRGELFQTYEQLRTHTDCLHLSTNIVHSLFDILTFLRNLPPAFNLGILKVSLAPIQMSLVLLIQMWKDKFSSYLLENFESQLNEAVTKHEMIHQQLDKKVECIFDLDVVLKYLCEIFNLEFSIEGTFSQIDLSYQLLESYEVTIKRAYLEEVHDLRKNWQIILERAKELQELYIKQNYLKYHRDIERETKTFEIQTINLLKQFEAEGPSVSGIDAETAVSRLNAFSEKYTIFLSKKELLSSLQTTYFIPTSIYSDLDKVGKEITKLKELYLLYENFCAFEDDYNSQTWSNIQFDNCHKQICQFKQVFEELDESFAEWDAYRDLGDRIKLGLLVVPILRKIQDATFKPRHWLRLMALGSKHFTINPQHLTLEKILKLKLVEHSSAIDEICKQAHSEAEVDKILKSISNELQDLIFIFDNTQDGQLQLSVEPTAKVLEVLDHHYVTLTTVLTSKYISHFLSEAAELSTQITTTQKFIQNITHSQTLAFQLDSIFKNNQTDVLPTHSFNEAQISFLAAFKRWKKLISKIEEPANIVLCCNHEHLSDQLEYILTEFENCQFSLEEYLDTIRKSYPFLYFLSDNDLLDLHQQQLDSDAIVPHVKQFFPQFVEFIYEEKIRRRSSSVGEPEKRIKYIKGFLSSIGEEVILQHLIPVSKDTFNTLNELMLETRTTLQSEFSSITRENREKKMPNAEYDLYIFNWETMTSQISLITLHSIWTKNVQEAIINFRSHKNALTEASSLFYQHINRLLALVNNPHSSRNPISVRSKLECIVYYGLWLRDISHDLAEKKPRDISDFEWQKYIRMYYHSVPVLDEPNFELVDTNKQLNLTLRCLFTDIPYGFDYIGNATPNYFLTSSSKTMHLIYVSILEQRHTQFKTNLPLEFMHSASEFARMHGRRLMPLCIHDNLSPRAMSCYLLGTLMSKSWGIINGWNNINKECLSIFNSVISRLHECLFQITTPDKSICIESSILMVVTSIDHFLPSNLRPYFKSCSYIAPNDHYILKLYCLARGIRSSKQLIDKMLWLKDILPIMFPDASHVRFTIPFFISMLNHISADKYKNKNDATSHRPSISDSDVEDESKCIRGRKKSIIHVRAMKQVQSHRVTFGNILSLPTDDSHTNPPVTNKDQKMIASYLVDICVPRFQPQFHSKFISLLDTLFGTSHMIGITDSIILIPNFDSLFVRVCTENGLIPTPILEQQVLAIHRAANTYHGFILYGKPGTGKTTAFNAFLSCIKNTTGDITNDNILKYSNHKTYYIYLKTLYSHLSLIGKVDERHCWRDGILSQAIRYANTDSNCLVWIIFDDIIETPLFEFIASCIYSCSLTLSNGQCLVIPNNVRFVLETVNLSSLSLSYLNLFQMLYFADDTVKFDSFAKLSIQKHPPHIQPFIQTALDKIMGAFLRNHIIQYPSVNECNFSSLFKTFFIYFDQLIVNYINSPSQPDPINLGLIERFTLFALLSSFGTHLEEYKWASFTQDLHSLSECLPDLEPGLTMYDYCISSLGDWDTLPMVYSDVYPSYSITCNGDIVVKCNNLYRVNMLAELCNSSERPIMLIGPHSSGKSCLIKNLIYTKCYEDTTQDVLHQAIDPCTTVSSLYDSLFSRLECIYLETYGPPNNHRLNFFIDDLHIGQSTGDANSPVQEFIRCLIERKGCFSKGFPTRWLSLKDVNIICALTSDSYQPWTKSRMSQHFSVIKLLPEVMTQDTVHHLLDALTQPEGMTKYSPDLIKTIIKTSQTLYQLVSTVFQPADIIGRGHYYFSWKELALIFHGFRVCADELLERESDVFNLLYHITNRVYSAQLCNISDIETFKCIMEKQWQYDSMNTSYIDIEFKDIPYFTTLVEEHKPDSGNRLHQSLSHAMEINTNIILHPSTQTDKLVTYATKLQNQYDDKFVEKPCISVLTISDIRQLDYLSFILSLPKSNTLLVGSYVNRLCDIARLAYFTAGFEYLELILSTRQSFIDGIKTAIRQAALGSKSVGFILTGEQLQLNYVRELFNTYLVTGHVDQVFSYDEFNSLVSSIEPIYKRSYANTYTDARQYFSVQIQKNLKVIICMEIHNPLLLDFKAFPGLIKGCYISLYKNWCGPNLIQDMIDLVNRPESKICIGSLHPNFPMENIITLCSSIHNKFIQEDRVLNIIDRSSHYTRNAFNLLDPFVDKDSRKPTSSSLSLLSFEDKIKYIQENEKVGKERIRSIEGLSLQKFIKVFFTIYLSESKNNERKGKSLKRCISTREHLQNMHEDLIKEVSRIEAEIIDKDAQCESLLQKLSQISCKLESVKVFSSDSDSNILRSTLATIRSQDETSMEMLDFEEDRQLISNLLENETQLKQSCFDEQTKKQKERIEELQINLDMNAKLVEAAASEVKSTFNKIGRIMLESVKLLHTPPKHVIQVLEILVFILKKQQRTLSSISTEMATYHEPDAVADSTTVRASNRLYPNRGSIIPLVSRSSNEAWNSVQHGIGQDAQKFLDTLQKLPWKFGLDPEIIQYIERNILTSRNAFQNKAGVTLITVQSAKHAAEGAGIICAYIIALAEYTYVYRQNCVFEEEISKLSAGITEISQKPITSHIDLPTLSYEKQFLDEQQVMEYDIENLEAELNETESEFHRAVRQQYQLKEEFKKQKTLTQALSDILKSTESLKSSWQQSIGFLYDEQTLLYYCIATSLLICYLGSTQPSLRKVFLDDALTRMSPNLEEEKQFNFSYEAFSEFLNHIIKQKPNLTDIPCDNYVQENISIIFNPYLPSFPLILDPYRMFLSWIREESGFMCTSYFAKNLLQLIDVYSKQSKKLVIYDVDLNDLAKNKAIVNILMAKSVRFGITRKPTYSQKELFFHTSFKLFLVCPIKKDIPYSLHGYVTPVLFTATREGFVKDLCRVCMSALEPIKYADMRKNEATLLDSRSAIENLENELSNALCISFQVDSILSKCKTITSLSSEYQINKENCETSKKFLHNLYYKSSHVFDGGEIAAIVFDVTRCMQSLNTNYQSSYPAFKHFIRSTGGNIDRINPKNIPNMIIRIAYSSVNQSFSEDDRVHFALVLAIEIEIFRKQARRNDAEMLFSPLNPVKHNTKKPFDWMQEKQWENFNAMGQSVKKIQDAVDRMAREGRATQWRTFCEHESPEEQDFPDGLNNTLSPLEKLLILKCVKQDNLKNSITRFIDNCLGVDLINGSQADYNKFVSRAFPPGGPLLIFSSHPLYTILLLNSMIKDSKTTLDVIPLYGNLPEDIHLVFEGISKAASQGNWLFVENIELNPQLMKLVPYQLDSLSHCHDSFRLWFGCSSNASLDPVFVQRCIRVYLGVPLDPKNSAIRCLELLDLDDCLEAITRTEWTPILHNLIMVHVACRYRVMLCPSSFGQHYRWSLDSLIRSLRIILLEIDQCANTMLTYSQQNKPFSWSCVKYMIGELTYGSGFIYAADIELLNGIFDYWLNPNAMKSFHEFPRSPHKIPNAFFKTSPRPKDLILGFLHETNMLQLRSPEICGLYSKFIFFSPDKIVNNTKLLNDTLKIYRIEEQQLVNIGPSTRDNIAQAVDKLKGYKKRSSSFLDVSKRIIGRFPSQTTSMTSLAVYATHPSIRGLKDLSIQEKCSLLLNNLPKLVSIEGLINKCEQYSNQYLQRFFIQELNTWTKCFGNIRSDLQVIQNYLLFSKLVGTSSMFLKHVIDLHENRVPLRWERLVGPSAPPNYQPFSTWIENLTKRLLLAAFCLLKPKTDTLNFEKSCLIGEITMKEKEHVKDPPPNGMYASDISVHGCLWDKGTGEFIDMPTPKFVNTVLPLVHITRFQASQLSTRKDGIRGPHLYYCPVYRNEDKKEIFFYIKVQNTDIPRIRWMMRGLTCTMQHY
ncbi:Dynein heavy chain 2, axonemal [Oopsacas minuta]|uniref:Dynein heavy chain 2, axonemal n=1 Tax=Oopsacas minuta TaxID=111878 RepID=A0AAV7K485_9METZ|nr:Dynein heavy chain 2, axonemal [Oopsacas minuta]